MKIYPEKLEANLHQLMPVYLVAGDEPLQQIEAADKIRAFCKSQNILERQILEEKGTKNPLTEQAGTMSLFAEQRLLEWRFEKGIKKAHGEFIHEFLQSGAQDILLITAPKLANEKRQAWYKAVEKMGLVVEVWPIGPEKLLGWLHQRARSMGLTLEGEAANNLAARCEGNLLAASQDLNMLALVVENQTVTDADVEQFVGTHSRYSTYEYSDACLSGNITRALRILGRLESEGTHALPLVNQLLRECQTLANWAEQMNRGISQQDIFKEYRVWPKRQAVVRHAMQTGSVKKWYAMIQRLTMLDKMVKGQQEGDVWFELRHVSCLIAGVNPFGAVRKNATTSAPSHSASSKATAQSAIDKMKKEFGMS